MWIGKDSIYKYIYNQRKDLVKYLRCQKGKYRRRYGTRIREKQREKLKKRRIDTRSEIVEWFRNEKDAVLILYTDGLTELKGPTGSMWGEREFLRAIGNRFQKGKRHDTFYNKRNK